MRIVALVLLVACGGGQVVDKPVAPTGPTCKNAAAKMGDMIAADISKPSDQAVNQLIALIQKRCETDRWSIAAVSCLAEMKTVDQADQCGTQLTAAQQKALVDDLPKSPAQPADKTEGTSEPVTSPAP